MAVIGVLALRTDGTVQAFISPGPTIRSVRVQNLTPIMIVLKDNGGNIYRVTAGQTDTLQLQPSQSVEAYTEQATTVGRCTLTFDDQLSGQSSGILQSGSLGGRGNYYDRITQTVVWTLQAAETTTPFFRIYDTYVVPVSKLVMLAFADLSLARTSTSAVGAGIYHELFIRLTRPTGGDQGQICKAVMPTWDRVASSTWFLPKFIWSHHVENIGPFPEGYMLELVRSSNIDSDFVYTQATVLLIEFDA